MSETVQTLSVVRDVFAAFDDHDLDRFRRLLHEDAVLDVGGSGRTVKGADAMVAAVGATFGVVRDLWVTVKNSFAMGATLTAARGRSRYTTSRPSPRCHTRGRCTAARLRGPTPDSDHLPAAPVVGESADRHVLAPTRNSSAHIAERLPDLPRSPGGR